MKNGFLTSEFWLSLAASVGPWVIESLPPTWKAGLTTAAAVVYTISRGLAKMGLGRGPT